MIGASRESLISSPFSSISFYDWLLPQARELSETCAVGDTCMPQQRRGGVGTGR
jgi:hypothetical protein